EAYGVRSSAVKAGPGGCGVVCKDGAKRDRSMECFFVTPGSVEGLLCGPSGQGKHEAGLRCVELATGKVRWSEPGLSRCSLLLVDGHLVCLTEYGLLLLLKVDPDQYEEVARMDLGRDGWGVRQDVRWRARVVSHGRWSGGMR